MNFSTELSNLFNVLRHQPMDRKLYSIIGKSQIDDGNFEPVAIQPNEDYFTLRLCEMYLTDIREYFRKFLPMAILISDFRYAGARHTVPFFLDNKMLGLESYLNGAYVEYKNTRVAGPFPYVGDDVALFTGLFRLEASNLAINLFNLFQNLLNSLDPCGLSQYLTVTKTLGQKLPSILNMKECEFRLGARDVYTENKEAPNQFRQNYIAYVNCPEHTYKPGELFVKNDRLYSANTPPVTNYDYCLMKIERADTRNDYTSFAFYSLWKEANNLLIANQLERSKLKKIEFFQQINTCPDLTETHKEELIILFELKYLKAQSQRTGIGNSRYSTREATRGVSKVNQDLVTTSLQSSAIMANKLNLPKKVGMDLNRLKDEWTSIPCLETSEAETKEIEKGQRAIEKSYKINQQLAALRKIRKKETPDPSSLVEALVFTTFKQ